MKKNAATDAVAAPSNHTLKEEKMDPQKLVEHFSMSPHPEGGFFAETYRSQGAIPADALPGTSPRGSCSSCAGENIPICTG